MKMSASLEERPAASRSAALEEHFVRGALRLWSGLRPRGSSVAKMNPSSAALLKRSAGTARSAHQAWRSSSATLIKRSAHQAKRSFSVALIKRSARRQPAYFSAKNIYEENALT
ncbi:hypothetical protein D1AOALGA4SA_1971 [Olavius algarvensis Delta 1 endosymbiont]|nr:hypothetical protein D1AOALGA4SA_1971 [Olavius algarvensis Delta 1 endosymbiont]